MLHCYLHETYTRSQQRNGNSNVTASPGLLGPSYRHTPSETLTFMCLMAHAGQQCDGLKHSATGHLEPV